MKCKKLLLTALAIAGVGLATMAQERRGNPGKPDHFVKEVPKGGKEIVYKEVHYHYAEGRYYRPQKEGFEMVQPPVGMEVNNLPPGYAVKKHKGATYYYKNDVCYKKVPQKKAWVIVKRPW